MNQPSRKINNHYGFTIIEILVTLGIIVIIATVITQIFKPTVYFQKTRDIKRITDLKGIEIAIRTYLLATDSPVLGPTNKAYDEATPTAFISVPFDKEDKRNLTFLWKGKTFYLGQVSSSEMFKNNGQGWLPIDFSALIYPPLSSLPIDPINSYDNNKFFYSYIFHRSSSTFELDAKLESSFYTYQGSDDKTGTDNGDDYNIYELGTDKRLMPTPIYY